jgi:polysaccharide pyruvyl transferase WcaK-like protein
MRIILHGCDFSTNFGDYLFGDIFFKKVEQCNANGHNIFFEFGRFGVGEFYRTHMNYRKKQKVTDLFKADLLIYFSGGYFGERDSSFKSSIKRFLGYMPIGIIFLMRKKPIMILGVGGGPISWRYLRKLMCRIMDYSMELTVRDEETASYYKEYGVKRDIKITSDTAQIITTDMLPDLAINELITEVFGEKKILFLHVPASKLENDLYIEKIIGPLNKFLAVHKEYGVILGRDYVSTVPIAELDVSKKLVCETTYYYDYDSPWQLCALLNSVDFIMTTKLHVGIIGSIFSKSVLSFPIHAEKVKRYYKQIGECDRCISLAEAKSDVVEKMINEYFNKRVVVPDNIKKAANENIKLLESNINALKEKAKL